MFWRVAGMTLTSSRWLRAAAAIFVTMAIAVGFPAPSAQAAPNSGPLACDDLIGMRDAYYGLYQRADDGAILLPVVARYTWDATDAGCFGTGPALRQRAFASSSMPW
jgi:hypothetical protein